METLVGFAVGFLVGTREGKEGMARICSACAGIKESAEVKRWVGGALAVAVPIARDLSRLGRAA
ncbi:MAG TPA: hypothetical protein VHU88_17760 [Sporichthyaceae bacterium]|jgi:hypothetical protein|nr:hypothetical protein [Sporichthyaceae bacterium]